MRLRSCDLSYEGESCRDGQECRERELMWGKMGDKWCPVNKDFLG